MTTPITILLPSQQAADHLRSRFYQTLARLTPRRAEASAITSNFSDLLKNLVRQAIDLRVSIRFEDLDSRCFVSLDFNWSTNRQAVPQNLSVSMSDIIIQNNDGFHHRVSYPIEGLQLAHLNLENIRERLTAKSNRELVEDLNAKNKQLQIEVEERRIAEETLRDTQRELIATEKLAALGGLVAGIAHEINTPVGIGVTAASHLSDSIKNFESRYRAGEMRRSDLDDFLSSLSDLNTMVEENLLRASRLIKSFKEVAVDQTAEDEREFNLREYVEQVVMSLSPKLRTTSVRVSVDAIDPTLVLKTAPGPIAQILTNLIMNSLIHGFDENMSGEISISARQVSTDLELLYSDSGKGISRENLKRIFEPFFTTKRSHGGSGLGMHLVYNIVTKKYSGKITCTSELNRGVLFRMTFPAMF